MHSNLTKVSLLLEQSVGRKKVLSLNARGVVPCALLQKGPGVHASPVKLRLAWVLSSVLICLGQSFLTLATLRWMGFQNFPASHNMEKKELQDPTPLDFVASHSSCFFFPQRKLWIGCAIRWPISAKQRA